MRAAAVILLIAAAVIGWAGVAYGQEPTPPCNPPNCNDQYEDMPEGLGSPSYTRTVRKTTDIISLNTEWAILYSSLNKVTSVYIGGGDYTDDFYVGNPYAVDIDGTETQLGNLTIENYMHGATYEYTRLRFPGNPLNLASGWLQSGSTMKIGPYEADTVPGQVTGLKATAGNQQIALMWTAPSDGGSAITKYEYQQDQGTWTTTGGTGTTFTKTGLSNGTEYDFKIRAVNAVGNGTASVEVSATPAAQVPGQVTGLTATAGNQQIALMWTAPSDGGSAITKYEYQQDQGTWTTTGGTGTTFTKTGLSNGTEYDFKIRAVNSVGNGTASAEVSATPSTIPGLPTGITATAGDQSVSLSWTAPVSNGGSAITKYEYTMRIHGPGNPWNTGWSSYQSTGTNTSVTITQYPAATPYDLTNGRPVRLRVRACNTNGCSANGPSGSPSYVSATPTQQMPQNPGSPPAIHGISDTTGAAGVVYRGL